jgi:hypothetical protein
VANQPPSVPEMRTMSAHGSLMGEEATMAKSKNRDRQRHSTSQQPTPDQRPSRPDQPQPPTPADMPRKRQQRRFGHN